MVAGTGAALWAWVEVESVSSSVKSTPAAKANATWRIWSQVIVNMVSLLGCGRYKESIGLDGLGTQDFASLGAASQDSRQVSALIPL